MCCHAVLPALLILLYIYIVNTWRTLHYVKIFETSEEEHEECGGGGGGLVTVAALINGGKKKY